MADNADDDTMNILIATDCHLGYLEKDAIRKDDSLDTFEEILKIGKERNVDFILLGGDLFHENKPSRHCMYRCMALLRKYCLGNRPCEVEFLSDQSVNFGHYLAHDPTVNYEDPNFNIGIPVFSIHGNHDDPSGLGNHCALDLLSVAGLVNYFGKVINLEQIEMTPLLLSKGQTKLALYGLGSVRDERLHRLFLNKQVKMLRPRENIDDWFNILVLHQNRSKHSATNWIPEQFLDNFLDLVFWGHEHECKIDPAVNSSQNFYVTQPGSSVATSLSEGETREKHVGILKIKKKEFQIEKIPLQTVRQFYMKDIVLRDTNILVGQHNTAKIVEKYCAEEVEKFIKEAEKERKDKPNLPLKPLVRLRVDYAGGYEPFNTHRFGQKYVDKVANPNDIILYHKKKAQPNPRMKDGDPDASTMPDASYLNLDTASVEDMLQEYFTNVNKKSQLNLLSAKGMSVAVKQFVEKDNRDAIDILVKSELDRTQKFLKQNKASEEQINDTLCKYRDENKDVPIDEASLRSQNGGSVRGDGFSSDSDGAGPPPAKRGRGRGRGRAASQSTRGRGRGRGKKADTTRESYLSDSDDDGASMYQKRKR